MYDVIELTTTTLLHGNSDTVAKIMESSIAPNRGFGVRVCHVSMKADEGKDYTVGVEMMMNTYSAEHLINVLYNEAEERRKAVAATKLFRESFAALLVMIKDVPVETMNARSKLYELLWLIKGQSHQTNIKVAVHHSEAASKLLNSSVLFHEVYSESYDEFNKETMILFGR